MSEANGREEQWKQRALLFRDAYREKFSEVVALEIQKMDLIARGTDVVLHRQNERLRERLMEACGERNRLRELSKELLNVLLGEYGGWRGAELLDAAAAHCDDSALADLLRARAEDERKATAKAME